MRLIDADTTKTSLIKALYELEGNIFDAVDAVEKTIDDASTAGAVNIINELYQMVIELVRENDSLKHENALLNRQLDIAETQIICGGAKDKRGGK